MRAKDWVLVSTGYKGQYELRQVVEVSGDTAMVRNGSYMVSYDLKNLHKAPVSMIRDISKP